MNLIIYLLSLINYYFKFLNIIETNINNLRKKWTISVYNNYCYYIGVDTDNHYNIIYNYDNIYALLYFTLFPDNKEIFLVEVSDICSNNDEIYIIKYVLNNDIKNDIIFKNNEKISDENIDNILYVVVNNQYDITKNFKKFYKLIKNYKTDVKRLINIIKNYSNINYSLNDKDNFINIMFDDFNEKLFKENEYIVI